VIERALNPTTVAVAKHVPARVPSAKVAKVDRLDAALSASGSGRSRVHRGRTLPDRIEEIA
jgi:hypothetical protein